MKTILQVQKTILFVIDFFLIFGYNSESNSSITRTTNDFVVTKRVRKNLESQKCSIICSDIANNSLVVQTRFYRLAETNFPVEDGILAHVYYKCNKNITNNEDIVYHTFQKLCGNRSNNCKEFDSSQFGQWQSLKTGKVHKLNVPISLPYNYSTMSIRTHICNQDKQFRFSYLNSSGSSLIEVDIGGYIDRKIKLSLIKLTNEIIADVVFVVSKSKCVYGWQRKDNSKSGYSCQINLANVAINAGYTIGACQKKLLNQSAERKCEEEMVYTANCGYVCLIRRGNSMYEGGYLKNKSPPRSNECAYTDLLCTGGSDSCVDEEYGFSCSSGTYNLKACYKNAWRSAHWRCPIDRKSISILKNKTSFLNLRDVSLFIRWVIGKYRNGIKTQPDFDIFYDIMILVSGSNGTARFGLSSEDRRYFATFVFERLLMFVAVAYGEQVRGRYVKNGVYYYGGVIKKSDDTKNIKLPPNVNESQFVTLYLNRSKESKDLKVKYTQLDGVVLVDERGNINNKTKVATEKIQRVKSNVSDYSNLWKNSMVISVIVTDDSSNKTSGDFKSITYKLSPYVKLPGNTWSVEFVTLCGTLDENKNWTWTANGCTYSVDDNTCTCNHLSNFAYLFGIKHVGGTHIYIFDQLSIVGTAISIASLVFFLIFIIFINSRDKLRIDQLNIALSLLLGTLLFMGGAFADGQACRIVAMVAQFAFLSAFVWMLIFGISVIKLITSMRYQNADLLAKYRYLLLLVGYGIPLIIVITSGVLFPRGYGHVADNVCWIFEGSRAWLTFVIPVAIVIALNVMALFYIALTLIRNNIRTRKTKVIKSNDLVVFVQLLVTMGCTWLPAMFAIRYLWAMYLFVIFFPLQGLLMFLLLVVVNKENREKVSNFISSGYHTLTLRASSGSNSKDTSKAKLQGTSNGNPDITYGIDSGKSNEKDSINESIDPREQSPLVELKELVTDCSPTMLG